MVKAPGFDRKMLLLATHLAHEHDLKPLLVAVLEALLADMRALKGADNEIETVTLVRQADLLLDSRPPADVSRTSAQMYHPLANGAAGAAGCADVRVPLGQCTGARSGAELHFGRRQLVETLVGRFDTGALLFSEPVWAWADFRPRTLALLCNMHTARVLIEAASAKKASALVAKDMAWLWRAAYNCAVQGCSDWPECELLIADLFDLSRQVRFPGGRWPSFAALHTADPIAAYGPGLQGVDCGPGRRDPLSHGVCLLRRNYRTRCDRV